MAEDWALFWKRFSIASCILLFTWITLVSFYNTKWWVYGFFITISAVIASAAIIGPAVAALLSYPFQYIFYPDDRVTPPPLYGMIHMLIKRGEYQRALDEYNKVISYHPQEYQAHAERLALALLKIGSTHLAGKLYRSSRWKLRGKERRLALQKSYEGWNEGTLEEPSGWSRAQPKL